MVRKSFPEAVVGVPQGDSVQLDVDAVGSGRAVISGERVVETIAAAVAD